MAFVVLSLFISCRSGQRARSEWTWSLGLQMPAVIQIVNLISPMKELCRMQVELRRNP